MLTVFNNHAHCEKQFWNESFNYTNVFCYMLQITIYCRSIKKFANFTPRNTPKLSSKIIVIFIFWHNLFTLWRTICSVYIHRKFYLTNSFFVLHCSQYRWRTDSLTQIHGSTHVKSAVNFITWSWNRYHLSHLNATSKLIRND